MPGESSTVFNAATVTAISAIISSLAAATVRIVTVRGKWRAQAADVLVDSALHERARKQQLERENAALCAEITSLAAILDDQAATVQAMTRLCGLGCRGRLITPGNCYNPHFVLRSLPN